jgi:hypothetical protein
MMFLGDSHEGSHVGEDGFFQAMAVFLVFRLFNDFY